MAPATRLFLGVAVFLSIMFSVLDTVAANCYDDFIALQPGAVALEICCDEEGATLPNSLTGLSALTKISLVCGTKLKGRLPAGLGDMSNLKHLAVYATAMTGPLPNLSKFTQMTTLSLAWNQFGGRLPDDFSGLSHLTEFSVRGNLFYGSISNTISKLTSLTKIDLAYNKLTGTIPSELGTLQSLKGLVLDYNLLTGAIPTQLNSLVNLNTAYLTNVLSDRWNNNRFHGGVPNFDTTKVDFDNGNDNNKYNYLAPGQNCATKEDQCSLSVNACSNWDSTCCSRGKPCPKSANCYENFVIANPAATQLTQCCGDVGTTLPNSLTTLTTLTKISLVQCGENLKGKLPVNLGSMSNLKDLRIHASGMTGPLPDMSKFSEMTVLELAWNQFNGILPTDFSALSKLAVFSLRGNNFGGSLPDTFTSLVSLTKLELAYNQFRGSIPIALGTMQSLNTLLLDHNYLTGVVPTELTNLANLKLAYFTNALSPTWPNNRFHGGLPNFDATKVNVDGGNDHNKYNYLAPGQSCAEDESDQCSLAADACSYLETCCTPGKTCRHDRSCSTSDMTCPSDGTSQFNCEDAQYCVEGFCGEGPFGTKGMCCGEFGINVGCMSEFAKAANPTSLSNWCMVCGDYSEFGLSDCDAPDGLPINRGLPSGATHIVCESDDGNQITTLSTDDFEIDANVKYLSLRGREILGGNMYVLNNKFSGLTYLKVSDTVNNFGNLILSSDDAWADLEVLDLTGTPFECAGKNSGCFHTALKSVVPRLRVLHISNMGLTKPQDIVGVASVESLEELYINDNAMESLPDNFFDLLTKLTKLRIRGNNIPGTLPDFIYQRDTPLDSDVLQNATVIGTATPTTSDPTLSPTQHPTGPTKVPSMSPSVSPSDNVPTYVPVPQPTSYPTLRTLEPTSEKKSKTKSPSKKVGATSDVAAESGPPIAVIAGAAGGGLLAIVLIVLVVMKKNSKSRSESVLMAEEVNMSPVTAFSVGTKSEEFL